MEFEWDEAKNRINQINPYYLIKEGN